MEGIGGVGLVGKGEWEWYQWCYKGELEEVVQMGEIIKVQQIKGGIKTFTVFHCNQNQIVPHGIT